MSITRFAQAWTLVAVTAGSAFAGDCGAHRSQCCPTPCRTACAPCTTAGGGAAGAACATQYQTVERTVLVPTWVTEKQTVKVTEYNRVEKERTVTVHECVPKTVKKSRTFTVLVPETKTRKVTENVCRRVTKEVDQEYVVCEAKTVTHDGTRTVRHPEWKEVEQEYTVKVPLTETKKGTRTVWRCVPVVKKSQVQEDQGRWVQRVYKNGAAAGSGCNPCATSPCSKCNPCKSACATRCNPCQSACATRGNPCQTGGASVRWVWEPKVVTRDVEYTAYERQSSEEDYEYQVCRWVDKAEKRTVKVCNWVEKEEKYSWQETVWNRVTKSRKVQVCDWVTEAVERDVEYTECVEKQQTQEYEVTEYERVAKDVKQTYYECVPTTLEKEIDVRVLRMVEKKVQCRVPVGGGCNPCNRCCK